jgi:hypothetical protein
VVLILALYGAAVVRLCFDLNMHTKAIHTVLSKPDSRGLFILAYTIILTPYILLPCIFDRFPRFVVQAFPKETLKMMARWVLGVDL